MQVQTNAIVLSALKYKDTSLIVRCYTQKYGIQSYLLHHILKSKKRKINVAYFQLLTPLEINATHKTNRGLHTINDVKLSHTYTSLHTNVYKSSVVLFLAEMLQNCLKEEEENPELYRFIETALLWFDLHDFNANFHLVFLLKLTKHLGIYPDETKTHLNFFKNKKDNQQIILLNTLLGIKFDEIMAIKMSAHTRNEILTEIINYFSVHLGDFKKPKSLAILHNVFK